MSASISGMSSVREATYCLLQREYLALVVVAGAAEGTEPHRLRRDRVQGREHIGEVAVDGGAFGGRGLRHERIRVHPAFDLLHDVEPGTDDARVLAQHVHPRNRHGSRFEGLHHPVLPIHLVGGGEERAGRLLAEDVLATPRGEQERGIALPALELPDNERLAGGEPRQLGPQKGFERPFVEAVGVGGAHRRQLGNVAHARVLIG